MPSTRRTQRCKWVAIDADYKNAMEDLLKLQYHLTQDKVEPALEMSKRGGHLWIFLAAPLLAKECRIYIHDLALRLGVPVKGVRPGRRHRGVSEARRHRSRRVWQRHSRSPGNPPWRQSPISGFTAQITHWRTRSLTSTVCGKSPKKNCEGSSPERSVPRQSPARHWAGTLYLNVGGGVGESDFRILAHVGAVRKVGRNYITRCPSCADCGHDRVGDNLAILIEDPRFYKCWAGCTKEMIRAALGRPIRVRHSA